MNDKDQHSSRIEEQLRRERNALSDALGASLDEIRRLRAELEEVKKRQAALHESGEEL